MDGIETQQQSLRTDRITQYRPLVRRVVANLHLDSLNPCLDFEDLVGFGTIGLIQAADRFDEAQDASFPTFAIPRIRGAVLDALRSLDHLPRSTRRLVRKLEQAEWDVRSLKQREPLPGEAAELAEMTVEQYRQAEAARAFYVESLDERQDDSDEGAARKEPLDDSPAAEERLEHNSLVEELARAVAALPERERQLIALYYQENLPMSEIARLMSISESRVCQLIARARERLRMNHDLRAAA